MRWVLLVVAIVGFAVAFTAGSPGPMGLGFALGCIGLLGFGLTLAAARIAQNAQSETVLFIDPEISALRAKANLARPAAGANGAPNQRDPDRTL